MVWNIKSKGKEAIVSPILIAGLPGIGNVSKITVDFMIAELGAKEVADITSYSMPHTVLVNEKNLIELPKIALYHKKVKNQDFLFLAGDAQPIDEPSTYELCDTLLDHVEKMKCKEIICLAGIGLQHEPNEPVLYCTANNKKIIDEYKKSVKLNNDISGVVGPIIGVAGLLPGLASRRNIPGIIILAETFAHPLYVGIKGAKQIVKLLNDKFKLGISTSKLDKDIKDLEESVKRMPEDLNKITKALKALKTKEINYIG
ncbi:MAG: PAC2 family protein [Candidatus Woesearchaeota archaeon]